MCKNYKKVKKFSKFAKYIIPKARRRSLYILTLVSKCLGSKCLGSKCPWGQSVQGSKCSGVQIDRQIDKCIYATNVKFYNFFKNDFSFSVGRRVPMRDFESSFHFWGMLGGLKGRKRRVKSIIYFLFSEQVHHFLKIFCVMVSVELCQYFYFLLISYFLFSV